jgi:ribosomal protein S18 acetylase RimI-like enzyme
MFQVNNEILYDEWLSDTINTNCYSCKANSVSDYIELKSEFKFNYPYFVSIKTFENPEDYIYELPSSIRYITSMNNLKWTYSSSTLVESSQYIDEFQKKDYEEVVKITEKSFKLDRFSLDDRLPQPLQSKVKISWIGANLRQERNTKTFVSRSEDGKIRGFSSLLLSKSSVIIDLIAVDPEFRNKGIASSLVRVSQEFSHSRSLPLEVGTQQTNPANGIYRKNGFILQNVLHVSHDLSE